MLAVEWVLEAQPLYFRPEILQCGTISPINPKRFCLPCKKRISCLPYCLYLPSSHGERSSKTVSELFKRRVCKQVLHQALLKSLWFKAVLWFAEGSNSSRLQRPTTILSSDRITDRSVIRTLYKFQRKVRPRTRRSLLQWRSHLSQTHGSLPTRVSLQEILLSLQGAGRNVIMWLSAEARDRNLLDFLKVSPMGLGIRWWLINTASLNQPWGQTAVLFKNGRRCELNRAVGRTRLRILVSSLGLWLSL